MVIHRKPFHRQPISSPAHFIASPFHRQPISSPVSTHQQGYKWTFHRHPTHRQGYARCQFIDSLFEARLSWATFGGSGSLFIGSYCLARWSQLYPTLLPLNGARTPRCIPREPRWYITTLIKLIGGHYLMPDTREGGRDTGVGRSSSIKPNSRIL